jgi:uncharacterized protein YaiI (UPF0178 family)
MLAKIKNRRGGNMQIFVDADACAVVSVVKHIVEKISSSCDIVL